MIGSNVFLLLLLSMRVRGAFRRPEKLVDMTYLFDSKTIYWPTALPFQLSIQFRNTTDQGFWYEANNIAAAEHGGTHLDAPGHFFKGRWRVDDIPPERFIAEGVVIDIKERAKETPLAQLTVDDILAWEKKNGRIPKQSIVFMNSGWQARWPNKTEYLGTTSKNTSLLKFPGFHPDAAKWLVKNRGDIYGIGVDTPSLDYGASVKFEVHTIMSEQNIYGLENVANLDKIPIKGSTIYALPMKVADGSGAPCRILATWGKDVEVGGTVGLMMDWRLSFVTLLLINLSYS